MQSATHPTARPVTVDDLVDRLGPSTPTVLAVWAHPDDESFLGAGLMAEVARRGGRVVNITATLGEHGTDDPDHEPPARLAVRRHAELAAALDRLGVAEHHVLGHRDGGCHEIADRMACRMIASLIEDVRPDVVIGFGPDGVTGHPDHRAVARWTARAVQMHGDTVPLLTTAAASAWPVDLVDRLHRIDAFWPSFPDRRVEAHWHLALTADRVDQKLAAMAAHESQIGPVRDVLGADGLRRLAAAEAYRAGNPAALHACAAGPAAA